MPADSKQAVSPARAAAFDVLVRVERDQAYANELLHSHMLERLSQQDRGLCMEIVMGVLRWRSRLDSLIAQFSFTPFRKLDFEVLTALRIGAYQLQFLAGIPSRAAVNESVNLVKRAKKTSAAPLTNVVLRKVASAKSGVSDEFTRERSSAVIARNHAHPEWMVERWAREYGVDVAAQICTFDQQVPATSVRVRAQDFELTDVTLEPGRLLRSVRTVVSGDVTHAEACREGKLVVQDEGSQLVAALVGRGSRILDCCAAPGGKTWAIADRNPEAQIVAGDLHEHRTRLMKQLVKAPNVEFITADATKLEIEGEFDRVLADVPCSGTGTLARNPEIKWRLKPDDLADLHQRQVAILNSALDKLASGGRLVYSTCSLEREENEAVVEEVLEDRSGLDIVSCGDELKRLKEEGEIVWDDIGSLTRGPYLRTIPGVHPCDGFFAAIIVKS